MIKETRILFVGDIVGGLGRRTLAALLPSLRERYAPTFVVVNGENAAGGVGITPKIADELFATGADVITLGNHTFRHREIYGYLDRTEAILRPANYLRSQPGHGWCVVEREGVRLGVVSLAALWWMLLGIGFYTLGLVFWVNDRRVRQFHAVWHVFVIAGSACHFVAILLFVVLAR